MKKKFVKLAACATLMAMVLSFSGCGSSDSDKKDNDVKQTEDVESSSKDDASDDKYSSVADYVSSDEVQGTLETLKGSAEGSGLTIDIRADGNKMVYSYQYTDIENAEGMADALKEGIAQQASTFQTSANAIKDYVDIDDATLVIEYVDKNGAVIYSEEFTAE